MELVYLVNGNGGSGGGSGGGGGSDEGAAAGYRLVRAVPTDGAVGLRDRCVTRIEVTDGGAPLRIVVPSKTEGVARDFFVRLVVTSDGIPEITFAAPTGEAVSFEGQDGGVLACGWGVNVFAFTETDEGAFLVNRKQVDVSVEVAFDPCGGEIGEASGRYVLGAKYGSLPAPTREGHLFLGWFTEAEGGVAVNGASRCKTGVATLYAHWEEVVDVFAPAICPGGGLSFNTDGDAPWFLGADGTARRGAVGDDQSSSLRTSVEGAGRLSFSWRTSSEDGYDRLCLFVDGAEAASVSGETDWADVAADIDGGGRHAVEWRYGKDGSVANGEDCGWLRDVAWERGG